MSEFLCILAGGGGTRLWPLSRVHRPKQLLALAGQHTLIQDTVDRLLPVVAAERILVVTGRSHADELRAQVPCIPAANFLVEPAQRGTAAALALAALAVAERDPAGVMASVHADSLILDAEEFGRTLQAALQVAGSGDHLVVMGITPTTPATQLGYIQRGERIGSANGYAVHQVRQFVEKPDRLTAERYLASGEYLWNPGVFAWRAAAFLRRVEVLMPDLWAPLRGAWAERGTGAEAAALERAYARAPAQAVEYGVIERTPNVVVIPARFRWSDIGDWGELLQVLPKDADGNVVRGDHLGIDTHRCLVLGSGRMVVTIGLEDLVVVETPDALLVCPRSRTQEVKQVVELLRTRGRVDLV